MPLDPQLIGAAIALWGGISLFLRGERQRRRMRDIVPVEATEGRLCQRCLRSARVCRFDEQARRWVYGAEETCLFKHCAPPMGSATRS